MTIWGFYGLILKQSLPGPFNLARKTGFVLTIAAGAFSFFYPPTAHPVLGSVLVLLWAGPAAIFLIAWFRKLFNAPYDLHANVSRERDDLLTIQQNDTQHDDLSHYLLLGQQFTAKLSGSPDLRTLTSARTWVGDVEKYIKAHLRPSDLAKFRHDALLPPPRQSPLMWDVDNPATKRAIERRCENLLAIIRELE